MEVIVRENENLRYGGKAHGPGSELEMADEHVEQAIESGTVTIIEEDAAESLGATEPEPEAVAADGGVEQKDEPSAPATEPPASPKPPARPRSRAKGAGGGKGTDAKK